MTTIITTNFINFFYHIIINSLIIIFKHKIIKNYYLSLLITKKWLYCLPNLVNMELSIDKRTVDILYVDKENLHNFTGTDIVKFVTNNDINGIDLFVALLSGVYNLKPAETNLLKVVVNYNRKVASPIVRQKAKDEYEISATTYFRSLYSLRDKGLVYIDIDNNIACGSAVQINKYRLEKAKLFAVELNPKSNTNKIL